MEKKLKIVIIGLGHWGKNFFRIVNDIENYFELIAIVDSNNNALNNIGNSDLHAFGSIDELLKSDIEFDAAIIATNTSSHYEMTKLLLLNNKHCLVEKPLTTSHEQAVDLYTLAEKNKLTLLVDHTFLYDESILALKNLIDEGNLGEILHYSFERTNLGPVRTDTNAAWDLSTHDLSILYAFINKEPKKIEVSSKAFLNKDYEDIVNISLDFGNTFVTLFSSWLHPEKSRIIKVVGDKKMAVWNGLIPDQELKIFNKGVEKEEDVSDYSINIFKVKSGSIEIPNIIRSEPLRQVVIDFYKKVNEIPSNEINNKKLTLNTIRTMEEINKKI